MFGFRQNKRVQPKHAKASGFAASLSAIALVTAMLTVPSVQIASAVATARTEPTPDVTGTNTSVSVSGSQIREGATLAQSTSLVVGSSALLNPGLGDREIRTSYDANTVYQSGSVQAPEGWTLQYSTNNGTSWVNSEPSPASSVTDIRATKTNVAAGLVSGYSQQYSTETVSSIPSGTFSGSGGGDGWGVDFYENYVLNVYHHSSEIRFECKLRATGGKCQDGVSYYTMRTSDNANYYAPMRSDLSVDSFAGVAYIMTAPTGGTNAYKGGVLCIDVKTIPPTTCGFTPLTDETNVTHYEGIKDITRVGTRYFGITIDNKVQLLCFDSATGARCPNSPVNVALTGSGGGEGGAGRTHAIGNNLYVKSSHGFYCYLANDLSQTCAGTWPKANTDYENGGYDYDIVTHTDSSGNADGVCIRRSCFDLLGVAQASWGDPFTAYEPSVGFSGETWVHRGVTTLGRYYWSTYKGGSAVKIRCFDFATNALCSGFDQSNVTGYRWYQVEVDPENPACLWANSDDGTLKNYDAYTGQPGCSTNPVITLQPSQFAPRYACSTQQGIDQWTTLRVSNLTNTAGSSTETAQAITLTVRNGSGQTVSGWVNKPVTLGQTLDMTGLDTGLSGSRPTFSFAFSTVSAGLAKATIALEYKGKGPEICSTVVVKNTAPDNTPAVINSYLVDTVAPAGTYQSQRNFIISSVQPQTSNTLSVPSAPRSLTGTGLNTNATLTFVAPEENGGLDLTGYQISMDGGSSWNNVANVADNGNGTFSTSLAGLTPGTTYSIRLAATNALGRGAAAQLSLTAQRVDLNSLADTYLSGGPIYLATVNGNNLPYTYLATPANICTVNGAVLSLVAVGQCSVTQNQAGDANNLPTSANASFQVLADPIVVVAPGAPLALTATPSSSQVSLSWSAPSVDGGGAITDYVVQYKVGANWIPLIDGVNAQTSAIVTGLTNGSTYSFKVAAVNSAGQGAFTAAVDAVPATVPGAPTSLNASKSGTSATLTWTAPASNGGASISDYKVEYKLTSEATWSSFTDGVSATTGATVTGLDSASSYDFQVTAKNAAGFSSSVSTVTLQATASSAAVALTWVAPNTGGNPITNYVVQYRLASASSWTDVDTSSTSTSKTLSGLVNGSAYDVRVAAVVDVSGTPTIASYTSTVRVNPFGAPAAPTLTATAGVAQVFVSWSAPNNNGSLITDYTIQYKATSSATWTTVNDGVSTLTFNTVTNLTNGTAYEFRALATNAAGASSYSVAVVSTPRTVPGVISNLAVTAGAGSLTISWTPPTVDGGAPVTDYQVQYKLLTQTTWSTLAHQPTTQTTFTIPSLEGLTQYSVRVAAVNEAGVGAYGPAGSEVTLAAPVISAPPSTPVITTSPNTAIIKIEPLKPGQVPLDNAIKIGAGSNLEISGGNLDAVEKVKVGDKIVEFEVKEGVLKVELPQKLQLQAYETTIIDKDGNEIAGPIVDINKIQTTIADRDALIKRLPSGEVKVWLFNPVDVGKVQFVLEDKEIAWVRASGQTFSTSKLRTFGISQMPYMVRTMRIPDGSVAEFEFTINGKTIDSFDIEGRAVKVDLKG